MICTKPEYDYVVQHLAQHQGASRALSFALHNDLPPLQVIYNQQHLMVRDSVWPNSPWTSVYRHQLADSLDIAAAVPTPVAVPAPAGNGQMEALLPGVSEHALTPHSRGHAAMPSADFRHLMALLQPLTPSQPAVEAQAAPDTSPAAPADKARPTRRSFNKQAPAARSIADERSTPQAPSDQARSKSAINNRRLVDAETGRAPTASTTRLIAYRKYYNLREVDVRTGKPPTDATQQTIPYGRWYHRRHVHCLTGEAVAPDAPDAISYACYRSRQLTRSGARKRPKKSDGELCVAHAECSSSARSSGPPQCGSPGA